MRRLAVAALSLALAGAPRPVLAGVDRWTSLGPPGGRALGLAFAPAEAGELYLSADGGLWKSVDGGSSWWHLTAEGAAAPLAVDPFDDRIVYAAPGDRIELSQDGGLTWTTVRTSPGERFVALAADRQAAGTVYALAAGHGVLKSIDHGWTWTDASAGLAGFGAYSSLALDPSRPGALYVSTAGGVYASADGARRWSRGGRGPAGEIVAGRLAVAAAPGGVAVVYAFVGGASGACLLRSTDTGASWTAVAAPALQPQGPFDCRDVAVDPLDAGRLFLLASDGSLYSSADGGGAWQLAGRLPGLFAALRLDPHDPRTLYALAGAGSDDGVARSGDGGRTWRTIDDGFDALSIERLATASGALGTLYALATDGALWKSGDYGIQWAPLAIGLPSFELAVDPFDAQHVLLALSSGTIASRDGGATWSPAPGAGPAGVVRLAFDPFVRESLLAGTADGHIFASHDAGASWAALAAAGPACASCSPAAVAFVFDPVDPRHLYAVVGGRLAVSGDAGASWTAQPAAGGDLRALILDPSAPRTLYAGGCDGVRKSPDGGITWRASGEGIALAAAGAASPACVERLAIDPRRPETLYAGAGGALSGLYRSTDAGASWAPLAGAAGLPADAAVRALALEPTDSGRLYAATSSLGVVTGRFAGAAPLGLGATPAGAARYSLRAAWRDFAGDTGPATPVALGADAGYFSFFSPADLELAVKVLDGSGVNGHLWAFYGSLTDVQFELTVADALTGAVRSYFNPAGQLASVGDTGALPALAAAEPPAPFRRPPPIAAVAFPPAPCAAGAADLCLAAGRFRATVVWQTAAGSGAGQAISLGDDGGYFWFFVPGVPELAVKLLDGRAVNGRYWLFYGALSDVEYDLRVEDLTTGAVRAYHNPAGHLASAADVDAF